MFEYRFKDFFGEGSKVNSKPPVRMTLDEWQDAVENKLLPELNDKQESFIHEKVVDKDKFKYYYNIVFGNEAVCVLFNPCFGDGTDTGFGWFHSGHL